MNKGSDELLKQLGRVTVNFRFMEMNVAAITWALLGNDQRAAQIATANLSFSRLSDVCLSLFRGPGATGQRSTG